MAELVDYALPEVATKTQLPKMYKVILLNDDYTPMDFVVKVLEFFFHFSNSDAVRLMLEIHFKGRALCGIFTRDVADTLTNLVNEYSREHEYPLRCAMEPE